MQAQFIDDGRGGFDHGFDGFDFEEP
jgi:hypothetical protein